VKKRWPVCLSSLYYCCTLLISGVRGVGEEEVAQWDITPSPAVCKHHKAGFISWATAALTEFWFGARPPALSKIISMVETKRLKKILVYSVQCRSCLKSLCRIVFVNTGCTFAFCYSYRCRFLNLWQCRRFHSYSLAYSALRQCERLLES